MGRIEIIEVPSPTLITEGSVIKGEITLKGETQILGLVEGEVFHESTQCLTIGKSGRIKGSIQSKGPVQIEGTVEGNITSATRIKLLPSASVVGQMKAPLLDIRSGAKMQGESLMKEAGAKVIPIKKVA
jgi:cytoskeletal protein CcmA (bactofilin family)